MFIKDFRQISKKDVKIAGGKGASLGEMTRLFGGQARNNPVPPGFVVLAGAFDRFLEETDLGVEIDAKLKKIKKKDINSIEEVSEEIRDMIGDDKFPEDIGEEILKSYDKLSGKPLLNPPLSKGRRNRLLVAVRSSATAEDSSIASWAGELESYLNVTNKDLLKYVKKCWSSLFTPRAIFYRFEKKLADKKVSVAVVVQKMIQSEISGIAFTAHPVTRDRNQMVIEAGWGLGEAIVGGKITPDTYIIRKSKVKNQKSKFFIIDKNVSEQKMMIIKGKRGTVEARVPVSKQNKQKLTDRQILKLAQICAIIEKHYRFPQDIEWALEKGKFYITQSRPITTL